MGLRQQDESIAENQIYTKIGLYKNVTVAIKSIPNYGPNLNFTINRLKELKEVFNYLLIYS